MWHTIIIAGNVGKDAEMRYTPSGKPVTSFSVACGRKYTNSSGVEVNETVWFKVTTWDKLAETTSQYVKKGMKVLCEGTLQHDGNGNPRTFQRKDGTTGTSFEITANTVRFISNKAEGSASSEDTSGSSLDSGEEIPF
jgi:single-strand DNA-binding protein